jgi:DNA polymerase-3 subunit alpha
MTYNYTDYGKDQEPQGDKMSDQLAYCSLHQHSCYSIMDSISTPEQLAARGKEIGMPAIALTDHGNIYGFIKMHKACQKHGIKFIPGCEFYFTHKHSDKERKSYHLTVLAMNNVGLSTLYKLVTVANKPNKEGGGFFYKPRIDWHDLEKYNKGLIVLSGCMASPVNREFGSNEDYEEGKKYVEHFLKLLGPDRFFIELQNVNEDDVVYIKEQVKILEYSRKVAQELGLKCVATNDGHYLKREDSFAH